MQFLDCRKHCLQILRTQAQFSRKFVRRVKLTPYLSFLFQLLLRQGVIRIAAATFAHHGETISAGDPARNNLISQTRSPAT